MANIAVWKLLETQNSHYLPSAVNFNHGTTSLNAVSRQLPGGVYTTFRTFEGNKVLSLSEHIARLEESAALVGWPVALDPQALRTALRAAIERFPVKEARVRLTVDLEQQPGIVYIALEPLEIPTEKDYQNGVRTVTVPVQRENPLAKQTAFIQAAEGVRSELPADVNEGLIVDSRGHILEGLSSNFFAVKDDVLKTAGGSVLQGITRAIVLQAAARASIPLQLESIPVEEIPLLQEAFITSSSRSVLPVRAIDIYPVASGKPGPRTRQLMEAYERYIQQTVEELS